MAFHFPLESVLRLRRSQQRQHELVLQKKNNAVNRLQISLAEIEAEATRISAPPFQGRSAAEVQFDEERLRTLALRGAEIIQRLRQAVVERDQAASEFHRAWQRRETLETLHQRGREAYIAGESRREQRNLDDWFLERKART